MVFIPNKLTEVLLEMGVIWEQFQKPQRLYQYLNWTIRISNQSRQIVPLNGKNWFTIQLINTELHDQNGNHLYALCIPNDVISAKAQKWYVL